MSVAFTNRRLPGVRFVAKAPPLDEQLPRMDVALFIGFAAEGPVNEPKVLETARQFAEIFGADLPLAWDDAEGRMIYAHLAPAVRAFFRNGGRRCWALSLGKAETFDPKEFLDPKLSGAGLGDLLNESDFIRFFSNNPRHLKGLHAALELEEVTIVAVPDAAHLGWVAATAPAVPAPVPSSPPVRPDWWHFLDCPQMQEPLRVSQPEWGNFLDCALEIVAPPNLNAQNLNDKGYELAWTAVNGADKYLLQEAAFPDFTDAITVYEGANTNFKHYGRNAAEAFYRAQAVSGDAVSDWSNGVAVAGKALTTKKYLRPADFQNQGLIEIHKALLRVCAARGDLLAVLSLPQHYRENEAREHVKAVTANEETRAGSYAAVYHPWPIAREEAAEVLTTMPPCGVASGVLARQALARGAWLAPANQTMRDVVALTPPVKRERWEDWQALQINLLRQEPRGFMALSADTLSRDRDYRDINVRRLMSLLRRLAAERGPAFVFEPNDGRLQRLVEREFRAALEFMFQRGAFAGQTAGESFRVNVGPPVNTRQSVEQGRFIVELRVAPAQPLTFLTVRLVQTGARGFVLEER